MKLKERECPKCGEKVGTAIVRVDFGPGCMCRETRCPKCELTWHEYYKIEYTGYSDESGVYNVDGVKEAY